MQIGTGATAVITGAGSGTGRALAQALAREGAGLELLDRDADGLAETARLIGTGAGLVRTAVVDVTDRQRVLIGADAVAIDVLARLAPAGSVRVLGLLERLGERARERQRQRA